MKEERFMITLIKAYDLFINKFPDAQTETMFDWGDFYTCSRCFDGDTSDDEWRIDKSTGEIRAMDFLEHMDELRKHPNDEDIKKFKVQDLIQRRASYQIRESEN